jgi:hypothetical protein
VEVGNGGWLCATTCTEATNFDTLLTVRTSCKDPDGNTCVVDSDDECAEFSDSASAVQWFAEEGVAYYLYVSGFLGNTGTFGLQVEEFEGPTLPLDACEMEKEMLEGEVYDCDCEEISNDSA